MSEPHIKCRPGDVAEWVLLPGDPGRVDRITAFLKNVKEIAYNREFRTCTGRYEGRAVSATSTGIGCPSAAIAMEELIRVGARNFIRIGTCGGLLEEMRPGDLVIPIAAMRCEGTTNEYVQSEFPAIPNLEIVNALREAARKRGLRVFVGVNRTHDAFYEPMENFLKLDIGSEQLVSSEMECSALFIVAALRNVRAGAILVVNTPEPPALVKENPDLVYQLVDEDLVRKGVDNAIQVALDAIEILSGR